MKTKTIFFFSIFLLTTSIKAQWTWQYNYEYGKPVIPEWYFDLNSKLDKIAVLPFTGYSFQVESLARRIESEIRSKLLSTSVFTLIEREYLMDIIREKHISVNNIGSNDIETFKSFLDADVLIVGSVTNYREEENFVDYIKGDKYACDLFKRTVTINFNFRIIRVDNGAIVFEKPYNSEYYSTGYKNIRTISTYNDNSTLGNINAILGSALDIKINSTKNRLSEYSYLSEHCINDIIESCYSEFVPLKSMYKESWQYHTRKHKKKNYTKTYAGKVFDKESMNTIRFISDIYEENQVNLSDTILYESFLENKRSWKTSDNEYNYFQFIQGRYYIQSRNENSFYESNYKINSSNYIMSLNLRYEDGPTDEGCYIKFRSGDKRYYVLIESSGDSYYKVSSLGSEWLSIKKWTKSDLIKSNKNNKIDIINISDKMYLFINGKFAFETSGLQINNYNNIGLGSSNAKYSFDNLIITKIE